MKKLLVLLSVLAVCGMASAALTWDVTPNGGDTYTVTLSSDVAVVGVSLGILTPDSGSIAVGTLNSGFSAFLDNGYDSTGSGEAAGTLVGVAGTTPATAPISGVLYTFVYTGTGSTIDVADYPTWGYVSQVTYTDNSTESLNGQIAVPEPMTMALLGLGGLFIRRRRA